MIHHEVTFEVPRPVDAVFGLLADVTLTPSWLSRCVVLKPLLPGPLAVGSKLLYTYREGGRQRSMDGEVAALDPNRRLLFRYWDKMVDVEVGFEIESTGRGTRVRHTMQLAPKVLFMKLLQPVIRRAVVKQTARDIARLQELLVAGS